MSIIIFPDLSLVEMADTIQVHFTLEGGGLKAQNKSAWMESVCELIHDKQLVRSHF